MSEELSLEKAQEVLQKASQDRLQSCKTCLAEVLEKHGCIMQVQIVVTNEGRLAGNIVVTPKNAN